MTLVQDNAPYHSMKAIPGLSARKQVYDFIKKQIDENCYIKQLLPFNTIRKFKLFDILEELCIALPSMKNRIYKLDIKVAQKGTKS